MHRFVVLLVAVLAIVLAQENSSDQDRVQSLEQRIRELEAIIEKKDRSEAKRTTPTYMLGTDPTKEEACTCHYCEDDFIRPDSCTDCEGYCDPCDFCTGASTSLMSAAACTSYGCTSAGYTNPPAITANTAEQCQNVYSSTLIESDAKPSAHWRWNGFDYLLASDPTNPLRISRVWLSFKIRDVVDPLPVVIIKGALYAGSTTSSTSPGVPVKEFTQITIDTTTKKWYSFEPSDNVPFTLTRNTRYFFVFGAYKASGSATFNMWTFADPKSPISLPAGYGLTVHNNRGFTQPNQNTNPNNWNGSQNSIGFTVGASASTIIANQNYQWYPEFVTTPVS